MKEAFVSALFLDSPRAVPAELNKHDSVAYSVIQFEQRMEIGCHPKCAARLFLFEAAHWLRAVFTWPRRNYIKAEIIHKKAIQSAY